MCSKTQISFHYWLQQIVDEWIEQYKADRDSGLRAIMQFFISASGCKGKITSQMQSSMEHAAIIRRMTEEFDEVSHTDI